jgi:phosphate:Na+ symporter
VDQLARARADDRLLRDKPALGGFDAEHLYQFHIKGVYGDLLSFMGRMELPMDEAHQQFWVSCQLAALQLVDAVKDAKHLQKNLGHYLDESDSAARSAYVELRRHLVSMLHELRDLARADLPEEAWRSRLAWLDEQAAGFDAKFRQRLFAEVRNGRLDGLQTSSLMNDVGYVSRIFQSLRNVLMLGDEQALFRELRRFGDDEESLIRLS